MDCGRLNRRTLFGKDCPMTDLQKHLYEQVLADHDYVVGLRRDFHRHPELGKEEFKTQAAIEWELDKLGIVHRRIAGTGVYADGKKVSIVQGILVMISTVLTHLFGGSTGREGAALQLGGSIGSFAAMA